MIWRVHAASLISAFAICGSTHALSADLADFPPDQQHMAKCMLSALRTVHDVTKPELRFSPPSSGSVSGDGPHVFLDYDYRYRTRIWPHVIGSPRVASESIEITDYVSKGGPFHIWVSGFTTRIGGFHDMGRGIFPIVDAWKKTCALDLTIDGMI